MRRDLNDRFVQSAKAVDKAGNPVPQADYFDEGNPGLAPRVSESGSRVGSFVFTSPADGKRVRMKLGTYPATSLAAARTRADEARGYLEEKPPRDPRAVFAALEAEGMTVAMLCKSYLEMHARS